MNQPSVPLFVTTAIPYVNAAPHLGHALELLLGDTVARHQRQRGRSVRFTGGTDDHSLKNARAAERLGVPTLELVRRHGADFRRLAGALGVQLDDYLHTSQDGRHAPAVQALWRRCAAAGDLYTHHYTGLYCTGCEAFLSEPELLHGACPTHRTTPEQVAETNWFFRLSRYQGRLLTALERGVLSVQPRERENEVLSFVRGGLDDFSVSRHHSRARGFGLPVPGDPTQVVYVWFDALASYLSVLGFPAQTPELQRYFGAREAAREHLIGKDILRFHAVYWPAILLSAGLPLPTRIRAHGFVTLNGEKLGKSRGAGLDPFALIERFGLDATRFYCLRHLHTTKDSDFRVEALVEAHDGELGGKLGNLLQRVTELATRHPGLALGRRGAPSDADQTLSDAAQLALGDVVRAVDDFALHQALAAIFTFVAAANRYADGQEPWTLSRRARSAASPEAGRDLEAQLGHVLWHLLEALRVSAVLLAPFLPGAAQALLGRLGHSPEQLGDLAQARFGTGAPSAPRTGPPLFPRLAPRLRATPAPL